MKGAIGEAAAISYFTRMGYAVSVPLYPNGYDLVIERDGVFQRVQCKFTSRRRYGWKVDMRRPAVRSFDLLFVLASSGEMFLAPVGVLPAGDTFRVGSDWAAPEPPELTESGPDKCMRCGGVNETDFKCCPKCRGQTAAAQRVSRARKRKSR